MKIYETTFIVNPQADDATLDRQVKAVTDMITNNGGKIHHEDRMGTRRLAYEIAGLTQGYYTSVYYEAPAEVPGQLDRHFRLEEPYIRHLTVIYEGSLERLKEGPRDEEHDDRDRRHDRHDRDRGRDRGRESRDQRERREESKPAEAKTEEPEKKPAEEDTEKTAEVEAAKTSSESKEEPKTEAQEETREETRAEEEKKPAPAEPAKPETPVSPTSEEDQL